MIQNSWGGQERPGTPCLQITCCVLAVTIFFVMTNNLAFVSVKRRLDHFDFW